MRFDHQRLVTVVYHRPRPPPPTSPRPPPTSASRTTTKFCHCTIPLYQGLLGGDFIGMELFKERQAQRLYTLLKERRREVPRVWCEPAPSQRLLRYGGQVVCQAVCNRVIYCHIHHRL